MKKLFLAACMAVLMTASAFADGSKVNNKALKHFNTEFAEATHVEWKTGADFAKASFIWNEQRMEAFYDSDGELIGTSRAVTLERLPMNASRYIQRKYADYTPTEAIEFDNVKEGLGYYVSLVKDNTKVVLQVSSQGSVSVFKKIKI
jgi:hypothetical protein